MCFYLIEQSNTIKGIPDSDMKTDDCTEDESSSFTAQSYAISEKEKVTFT